MGFENIETPFAVHVSDCDSHARLLYTVVTQGNTTCHPFLTKCPIVIVHQQQARC